jgi:hypothetical protein
MLSSRLLISDRNRLNRSTTPVKHMSDKGFVTRRCQKVWALRACNRKWQHVNPRNAILQALEVCFGPANRAQASKPSSSTVVSQARKGACNIHLPILVRRLQQERRSLPKLAAKTYLSKYRSSGVRAAFVAFPQGESTFPLEKYTYPPIPSRQESPLPPTPPNPQCFLDQNTLLHSPVPRISRPRYTQRS